MAVNASSCPLCGKANLCAMELEKTTEVVQPPCWCASLKMDASLLGKIPLSQRGLACICQDCSTRIQTPRPT